MNSGNYWQNQQPFGQNEPANNNNNMQVGSNFQMFRPGPFRQQYNNPYPPYSQLNNQYVPPINQQYNPVNQQYYQQQSNNSQHFPPNFGFQPPPPAPSHFAPYPGQYGPPPPPQQPNFGMPAPLLPSNDNKEEAKRQTHLQEFLQRRGIYKKKKDTKPQSLTLFAAKNLLKQAFVHMTVLSTISDQLTSNQLPASNFASTQRRIQCEKEKINEIISSLSGQGVVKQLSHKFKKARRKRFQQKRQRERRKREKEELEQREQEEHRRIDAWREEIRQAYLDFERAKQLKEEADVILEEIRRKKSEMNRVAQLLESVRQLRKVRRDMAEQRGIRVSPDTDSAFSETIERLEERVERQRSDYLIEERTLRVMIDDQQQTGDRTDQLRAEWVRTLFGDPDPEMTPANPLYQMHLYQTAPERELDSLVQRRAEWDRFLVSGDVVAASGVPIEWVVPCAPSSQEWELCRTYN